MATGSSRRSKDLVGELNREPMVVVINGELWRESWSLERETNGEERERER